MRCGPAPNMKRISPLYKSPRTVYNAPMSKAKTKKRSSFPISIEVNGFVVSIETPRDIPFNIPFKVVEISNAQR